MVLKKRTYYGEFHGFLAPVIPKAPRSLRRRSLRNKSSGGEICAFELLAAVAGKLLQESESSTSSISTPKEGVKNEPLEVKVKPERLDNHDHGSGAESELLAQPTKLVPPLTELPQSENDSGSEHASFVATSDFINKVGNNLKTNPFEDKNGVNDIPGKPEGGSPSHQNLCDVNFDDNQAEVQTEAIDKQNGGLTSVPKKTSTSVHLSFYRDPVHNACFPRHQGDVNINSRDDDEKYFRYYNRNTRRRAFGSRSRAGYRKMRKMMTSRYWKVAPKLKDYELPNTTSVGVTSFYHKRKNIYMRERFQADAASKRRKLFHHSSKIAYVKKASGESKSNSVKFSIKSFKVPELYVEVPETATVGSLKRSVMEAVTAILRGKLHVGVLLHGKKVRDDNRTLQQFGISQNCNLESLGFTLEPSLPKATPFLVQNETQSSLQCNTQQQLSRSPSSPVIDGGLSNSSLEHPPVETTLGNYLENNEESTTLSGEVTTQEPVEDSKALVLVQPVNAEILSMVPLTEKPTKRYELSQRRTRRPFSVSEVEALVEAVEILGAGRWRDVKMRAFGDANHRTYVDLKDKWKTLVHTASISPQQRRGEPVPQDLLDRVLAAHAYWSQHQSKQHTKHQKTIEAPM